MFEHKYHEIGDGYERAAFGSDRQLYAALDAAKTSGMYCPAVVGEEPKIKCSTKITKLLLVFAP